MADAIDEAVAPPPMPALSPMRQLAKAAASMGALNLLSMGVTFFVGVLLARQLGPAGYGTYALAMAVATLAGLLTEFGLPLLIMREFAAAGATGAWGEARGLVRWSNRLILALSTTVLGGFFLAAVLFDFADRSAFLATMLWAILLIPIVALAKLRGLALLSLGRTAAGQFPVLILRPGLFAVALAAVWLLRRPLGAADAMMLQVGAAFVALLTVAWSFRRLSPPAYRAARPQTRHRAWIVASVPMAMTEGLRLLGGQMAVFLLGIFATTADVGHYRVADAVALVLLVPTSVMSTVASPLYARLSSEGETREMQRITTLIALVLTCALAVAALALAVVGKWAIITAFGAQFAPSFQPLLVLVLGNLIVAALGPGVVVANMIGLERFVTAGSALAVGTQLVVSILLVEKLGAGGAAIGTVAGLILWAVFLAVAVHRRTGINVTILSVRPSEIAALLRTGWRMLGRKS